MICFCFLLLGFSNTENFKKKEKAPPGTVRLNDTLFIDKTETANVHWREFQYWLQTNDSSGYRESLLDTLVWRQEHSYQEPMVEYYFRHPSYNYFPVVGVSYEQAIAFCKWRSHMVNQYCEKNPSKNPFPNKKYRYRLPTKKEWEFAASGKLDIETFPFGYTAMYHKKRGWLANTKSDSVKYSGLGGIMKEQKNTTELTSYYPNSYGCYNMIGNVSEMVSTKGIAKGGNFLLPLDSCKIRMEQHYTKPEAWLGFRCVCEMVE